VSVGSTGGAGDERDFPHAAASPTLPRVSHPHESAFERTLRDLSFRVIEQAIAERCSGPLGATLVARGLPIARTIDEARERMDETAEAMRARHEGDPAPLDGMRDARPSLLRVGKGGVLSGPALADVLSVLGTARDLRRFLAKRKSTMPRLAAACAIDPGLDALADEIAGAIDPTGAIHDHASPTLKKLRAEIAALRARIVGRLEEMLVAHADVVSDRFVTERDGRYVLPMRTDAHDRIPGIVHGTSQTGATVFVEPRTLVEPQNRLTLARSEMEIEETRILARTSELVLERAPELEAALDALDRADLRDACGRLGLDLRATVPELIDEARIEAKDARHPLLVLEKRAVVANDVAIAAGHALVLSGPNAGGKTIALKLLGLFALMARAGVPVPASEGVRIGFFDAILSDVGDDQSIEKSLSTFSAHVTNVARILDAAGSRALVLLDEVATGTDPEEGAALACAIVTTLLDRGAAVAVTTHYEALKALALADARLTNGSVGFDVEKMAPTFELRLGAPGASSALRVARRFGLDAAVVARAEALVPETSRVFDRLVRRLEEEVDGARRAREAADGLKRDAERAKSAAETELRALRERERNKLGREAEKLVALLKETREEVRAARNAMRKNDGDAGLVEAAKHAIERAQKRLDADLNGTLAPEAVEERGERIDEATLAIGDRVWVPHLRAEVDVIEAPQKGRVRVRSGAVKLTLDVADLRRPERERPIEPPEPRRAPTLPSSGDRLDLRGLRVDEALALAESFLDRAYAEERSHVTILHGVGSGAVRDALRGHLRSGLARWVRSFRPGTIDEGGDRVTVVLLG
jgi:DNA mismatch repair protein MutS2